MARDTTRQKGLSPSEPSKAPAPVPAPKVEPVVSPKARVADLEERRTRGRQGGGQERIARQHAGGKLTARERIERLADPESFVELDLLRTPNAPVVGEAAEAPGDGVVVGRAAVLGVPVYVAAQDFTVQGGSLGSAHAAKICKALDRAIENRTPIVLLNDSGGARIQEGVASLGGYGDIFYRNTLASGLIPQISIIMGPCAGGAVYSPALTDFVVMVDGTSYMFLTGPEVVKSVTGEETTAESLGGARVHAKTSGVAHLVAKDEEHAFELVRKLLSYLPRSADHPLPLVEAPAVTGLDDEIGGIVPPDPSQPYDMLDVVRRVLDRGEFLEIQQLYAPNMVVGFGRVGGIPVGVVANQPKVLAGVLDIDASVKAARFVRFCDAFHVPIVTFVDVPGFLPGKEQEHGGIIRHGAKLVYAYCEASVPKITLVTRKAYGGAYIAMASKHLHADVNLAWPSSEIAVMGAEGAVNVLHKRDLAAAADPDALKAQLLGKYREAFNTPYQAAGIGFIDEVVRPDETRARVAGWLRVLLDKKETRPAKKHGNPPL